MMNKRTGALLVALAAGAACKDSTSVGDLNNVSTAAISAGLTRASVQSLVTGLIDTDRGNNGFRHIVFAETMARDIYNLDPAENRFITELIGGPSDNGGFVGGGDWTGWFVQIRTANTILNGLDAAPDLSASEKSATRGVVRTFKALGYYHALEMRDSLGLPIDLNRPPGDTLAPFRCKANVLAYISALLDSANTDLAAGGSSFPFTLPSGFNYRGDFTTPSTFAEFVRGYRGKVELYRALDHANPNPGSVQTAITLLNSSFLSLAPADTGLGVYYLYSTQAGETVNPVDANTIHLNPSVGDSIMSGDARAYKIIPGVSFARNGVKTTYDAFTAQPNSANLVRPMALLKNEELVLLRAQAEIQAGDLVSATRDINYVHVNGGGLTPYPLFTSATAAINAVLYEKRYSLLLEGAQRLVDLRAYNRFNSTYLKQELSGDIYQEALPIPKTEIDARGGNASAVTPVCQ